MRFTGRPRLIPDEDSTRCMTRSTAGTSWNRRRTQAQPGLAGSGRTPPVKGVGEPCAGEPHARFDGRGLETERTSVTAPAPDPTNLGQVDRMRERDVRHQHPTKQAPLPGTKPGAAGTTPPGLIVAPDPSTTTLSERGTA